MRASLIDAELCMRHDLGKLMAILSKHVDDLELAGTPEAVKRILTELQKVFGKLKVEWLSLIHISEPTRR
eukprot:5561925-Lingulodinium_polyedra.AAC.1